MLVIGLRDHRLYASAPKCLLPDVTLPQQAGLTRTGCWEERMTLTLTLTQPLDGLAMRCDPPWRIWDSSSATLVA